jgi:hypothetical protein
MIEFLRTSRQTSSSFPVIAAAIRRHSGIRGRFEHGVRGQRASSVDTAKAATKLISL